MVVVVVVVLMVVGMSGQRVLTPAARARPEDNQAWNDES